MTLNFFYLALRLHPRRTLLVPPLARGMMGEVVVQGLTQENPRALGQRPPALQSL